MGGLRGYPCGRIETDFRQPQAAADPDVSRWSQGLDRRAVLGGTVKPTHPLQTKPTTSTYNVNRLACQYLRRCGTSPKSALIFRFFRQGPERQTLASFVFIRFHLHDASKLLLRCHFPVLL